MYPIETQYSMPSEMVVCHDSQGIYGLQLTLKQQKYAYPNEEEMLEEYGIEKTIKVIDESILRSEKRILDLIGSKSEVCEPINLT